MNAGGGFAARLLESGAGGLAGLAASLLFERHPDLASRYGSDAFPRWREQLADWLRHLCASIEAEEPALFEARVRWTSEAFASREVAVEDLRHGLEALRDTIADRLPDAAAGVTTAVVDAGLVTIGARSATDDPGLDPKQPDDRRSLEYIQSVLEGRPREAIDRVLADVDSGRPVREAYLRWLLPAQREAGRMWHAGELSIAEERLITSTTQQLMALLCARERPGATLGRTVVLACVSRNVHDLGLRAIADFFEMAGWRTLNLGADVPSEEIARSVAFFEADLVVIAATLDTQLRAAQQSIAAVRGLEGLSPKIIVGGAIFAQAPELWRKLDADGYAATIGDAEPLGRQLTD